MSRVILSVTPNPTIDRVVYVRNFRLDAVVRAEREAVTPCGKGVNASMVIHELGGDTLVLGLRAGFTGDLHARLLDDLGVPHDLVPAEGESRMQTILVDEAVGKQSSISAPTLHATPAHLAELIDRIDRHRSGAWGLICGGSLPQGLPADSYARILRHGRERGLVTLLDSSGEGLRGGVAGLPYVLKINRHELAMLDPCASDLSDMETAVDHLLPRLGVWASDAIVVTVGIRGAVAVTAEGVYTARALDVPAVNTAGAGDAMSGALMLARSRGQTWSQALALGTAAAGAVVMTEGTGICRRVQVEALLPRVRVTALSTRGIASD